MTNHLQTAQSFTQELLQTRDDIIAVLLVGSAASGEVTAFSDVDLRLIVEGHERKDLHRQGIDRWVDGIYVDSTFVSANDYSSVDRALSTRSSADALNFGRILYDSTGQLETLRLDVQARYMEPEWLAIRVDPMKKLVNERLPALRQAIDEQNPLTIHIHAGRVFAGLGFLPLLQQGTAVSSSRSMTQLVQCDPAYARRLLDIEGASNRSSIDVLSALDIFAALSELDPHQDYATLAEYMVGKARWMAGNGYHREAVHTTWLHSGNRAAGTEQAGTPDAVEQARALSTQWLSAVGWVGGHALRERISALEAIWAESTTKNIHEMSVSPTL